MQALQHRGARTLSDVLLFSTTEAARVRPNAPVVHRLHCEGESRRGFELWAFVIMPEHVHLVLLPHEGTLVEDIFTSIKTPVSRRAVAWVKRRAPSFLDKLVDIQPSGKVSHRFWQRGGGYDRNLWSAEQVHQKIEYVHQNPVRQGLVEQPDQWRWSSFLAWENGVDDPIRIDRETVPTLGARAR